MFLQTRNGGARTQIGLEKLKIGFIHFFFKQNRGNMYGKRYLLENNYIKCYKIIDVVSKTR